jgi:hypothetical protein
MVIEKMDLTQYSENELSMLVFNIEFLYNMRRNIKELKLELDEIYDYTEEQFEILVNDIKEDLGEL